MARVWDWFSQLFRLHRDTSHWKNWRLSMCPIGPQGRSDSPGQQDICEVREPLNKGRAIVFSYGSLSPGDVRQCPDIFDCHNWGGVLLNTKQYTGQLPAPQQIILWPQMSRVLRVKSPRLTVSTFSPPPHPHPTPSHVDLSSLQWSSKLSSLWLYQLRQQAFTVWVSVLEERICKDHPQ